MKKLLLLGVLLSSISVFASADLSDEMGAGIASIDSGIVLTEGVYRNKTSGYCDEYLVHRNNTIILVSAQTAPGFSVCGKPGVLRIYTEFEPGRYLRDQGPAFRSIIQPFSATSFLLHREEKKGSEWVNETSFLSVLQKE